MKKIMPFMLAIAFVAFSFAINAQDEKAQPSPFSKVEQKVGTTDVTIEYSRPGVKGRTIFGDLVPYDKRWRTGANAVTKITFSKDVTIEGKTLAAGSYALMTTPGSSSWKLHFFDYKDGSGRSYPADAKPALTVSAPSANMGEVKVESFLITIDGLRDDSASLMLVWDNIAVTASLGVK